MLFRSVSQSRYKKVEAFSARLKEPAERFEAGKWKKVNGEIGELRKKVTGGG